MTGHILSFLFVVQFGPSQYSDYISLPLYFTLYTHFSFSYVNAYGDVCILCAIFSSSNESPYKTRSLDLNSSPFCLLFVWQLKIHWKHFSTYSVTGLTAVAMDVAVPRTNIREDSNGNPVLSFYVQFSSSVFLSADTLAAAVMVSSYCSSVCKCYNYIVLIRCSWVQIHWILLSRLIHENEPYIPFLHVILYTFASFLFVIKLHYTPCAYSITLLFMLTMCMYISGFCLISLFC